MPEGPTADSLADPHTKPLWGPQKIVELEQLQQTASMAQCHLRNHLIFPTIYFFTPLEHIDAPKRAITSYRRIIEDQNKRISMGTQSQKSSDTTVRLSNRPAPTVDHVIGNLAALTYANTPAQEIRLGTPRRTPAILTNHTKQRLTAVQKEYRDATVYYLKDTDYLIAYRSHHNQRTPSDDNISFVLPKEGIVVVRVRNNLNNSSALSPEDGTALISETHHALLQEAVKHGLSELRGLTEGAIHRDIQERRERLREGRLVLPSASPIPEPARSSEETLHIKSYTSGINKKVVLTELKVHALTCHEQTIFLADQASFTLVTKNPPNSPVTIVPDNTRGDVLIINADRISHQMPEIRSQLLQEPTAASVELLRYIEDIAIQQLTADVRDALGASAFEILLSTLQRHRVEPLHHARLIEALHDVAQETTLTHSETVEAILEAVVYLQAVDERFGVNIEQALDALEIDYLESPDPPYNSRKLHKHARRATIQARALSGDPSERVEAAQRNILDNIPANTRPIEILLDQVDRVGRDAMNSMAFIRELRRNAPGGIEIPQHCQATQTLRRDQLGDPRGPYLQAEFDEFEVNMTLKDASILTSIVQVRWHTPTQTEDPELPGYRVTLLAGSHTYELTSIRAVSNPANAVEGELFVANASGLRTLFLVGENGPQELGTLSDFGLIETADGYVYSRSACRQRPNGQQYQTVMDATGQEVPSPIGNIIKNLWHLPYIPERMDITA